MNEPATRTASPALVGAVATVLGLDDPGQARLTGDRVETLLAEFPAAARGGVHAAARALDGFSRLRTGHRLADLDPARREALCASLAGSGAVLSQVLEALKIPILLVAGPGTAPAESGGRAEPVLDCVPSSEWPTCTTADAVVVGSGAGGAAVARTLARAGMRVLVLEEGRRWTAAEFRSREPWDRFRSLYRDGGGTFALGRPPVSLPVGRGVGGTTLINSGTCFRTPGRVLRRWRHTDGIGLAERLPELFDEVERTLEVAPAPLDVLGRNGQLALEGARRLGWQAYPLRRAAPGCGGCCQCFVGCPRNAKNSVHLNALPQACAAGARIVTGARVERVLVETHGRSSGTDAGRAVGVAARRPDGSVFEILSPIVVVAAGATETPPLLRRSGLGGHPGLGRGLAIHPATQVVGRFAEPVVAWSGVLQSVGIEPPGAHGGFIIEATSSPPGIGTPVLPGIGRVLREELARADQLAFLGAMVADGPSGRVHGKHRSLLRYDLAREDAARLREAIVAMGRVLFAAGAEEVLTGMAARPRARTLAELENIAASAPVSALRVAGFHPTGSARMGADPERAPVAPDGRLRGVEGVFVADASVLPSAPSVNPQITIMAMAFAIADEALQSAGARQRSAA